jgi:hypothetical protein
MDFVYGYQREKTGFGNGAPPHYRPIAIFEESALVSIEEV